jgi:diguanylate cyclase (GGDEF)-like protein
LTPERALKVLHRPADTETVKSLSSDRPADVLLADEEQLAGQWCTRFAVGGHVPVLAHDLLHAVLRAVRPHASGPADPALSEAAWGLGVLRAQQGNDTVALVEDVLALRRVLWTHLAASPAFEGDAALLLMVQAQLADVLDEVLRATVDAYVEEAQRVLRTRATRDPLTGLLNRAAFEEALQHEVAGADREAPPALLLVDLDGFKQVNDTLGHLTGDDVLVRVARLLEAGVRKADIVARLGGDEFAVLLPRTTQNRANDLARRLLARVRADEVLRDERAPVGFSIGLAWLAEPRSGEELVAAADDAMYRAKRGGGQDVAVAPAGTAAG